MLVFRPVSKRFPITDDFHAVNPRLRDGLPHKGIDFGCPIGSPAWACFDGTVSIIFRAEEGDEKQRRAGNRLAIDSLDGKVRALYFHLSSFNAKVGQKVKKGDVVAFTGDTGVVTGAHLHFQTNLLPQNVAFKPEFEDESPNFVEPDDKRAWV